MMTFYPYHFKKVVDQRILIKQESYKDYAFFGIKNDMTIRQVSGEGQNRSMDVTNGEQVLKFTVPEHTTIEYDEDIYYLFDE